MVIQHHLFMKIIDITTSGIANSLGLSITTPRSDIAISISDIISSNSDTTIILIVTSLFQVAILPQESVTSLSELVISLLK